MNHHEIARAVERRDDLLWSRLNDRPTQPPVSDRDLVASACAAIDAGQPWCGVDLEYELQANTIAENERLSRDGLLAQLDPITYADRAVLARRQLINRLREIHDHVAHA